MKHSIFEKIVTGDFRPYAQMLKDAEYMELLHKIVDEADYFKDLLPEGEHKRFIEFQDLGTKRMSIDREEYFKYAFQMGALFIIELMTIKSPFDGNDE